MEINKNKCERILNLCKILHFYVKVNNDNFY